jgi:hypothetical protein
MVVPVPVVLQKENVKTLPRDVFQHLETLSAPRLVEYWEQDPCPQPSPVYDEDMAAPVAMSAAGSSAPEEKAEKDYKVTIEAKFSVGEYDIVILGAKESDGLEHWLHDNGYMIPSGAAGALAPYIEQQQKFFVARVDIKKVQPDAQGVAVLSPLRFSYEDQDFRLPVRLGLLNAKAKQDLIVYVMADKQRYEVSNYPNVYIPTNLEVTDKTRDNFGAFYAALFDTAIAQFNNRAIVTEYAWPSITDYSANVVCCDPCPTSPLDGTDAATLGADVLFPNGLPNGQLVLTRLHARYDQSSLNDDLIFHAVPPIVGGRETPDANGVIEKGAQPSDANNFQARYVIRHPWTGPIACEHPQRGIWGGPPSGVNGSSAPVAAMNIAAAPRGAVKLGEYLKDPVLGIVVVPAVPPGKRACGCSIPGAATTGAGAATFALGALVTARMLRRRKSGASDRKSTRK